MRGRTQVVSAQESARFDPDEYFGLGLLLGQIVTHCEHIKAGGKLAAQVGCDRSQLAIALDAIRREGCISIVEADTDSDRVSIWLYQKAIAEALIDSLNRGNAPSQAEIVIAGKLFGYSDNEIEDYMTRHLPATIKATSESESSQRSDSDTDGLRKAQGCSAC